MKPVTVATVMAQARKSGLDRLDAQLLLADVLACSRTWVLAHDDAELDPGAADRFAALAKRRASGEPTAYLLGKKEFFGLMLQVSPKVLVPRPDTEVLVEWALELLRTELASCPTPSVLDLGTGSGAIALAVKSGCSRASVTATDVSPDALSVARANAQRLGLQVLLGVGSWWQHLEEHRFHLVLSNPPYIPQGDPHLQALTHEPTLALTAGDDGLSALNEIAGGARAHLEPCGWLLLEHGPGQASAVRGRMRDLGFADVQTRRDLAGRARCTGAHL